MSAREQLRVSKIGGSLRKRFRIKPPSLPLFTVLWWLGIFWIWTHWNVFRRYGVKLTCQLEKNQIVFSSQEITGGEKLMQLFNIVCKCSEFQQFTLRVSDKKILNEWNTSHDSADDDECPTGQSKLTLRFPISGKINSIPAKVSWYFILLEYRRKLVSKFPFCVAVSFRQCWAI